MHDVLEVLHRARQAVDAGDDEGVALIQKLDQYLQLGAAAAARAACLLGADDLASGRIQRGTLGGEILVDRGDASVAVEHGCPVLFGS